MSAPPNTIGGFPISTARTLSEENVKILVTGPPKTGKTSSVARAYATYNEQKVITGYRIFFIVIGDRTALDPLLIQPMPDGKVVRLNNPNINFVLIDPLTLPHGIKRVSEGFWAVANAMSTYFNSTTVKDRAFDAIGIDGLNFLGSALEDEYEKHGPRGWDKWTKLEDFFCSELIAWASAIGRQQGHGLDIYFIGHSSDPQFKEDGKLKVRGGATLPTKKLSEQFPGKCDLVLRADTVAVPGSHAKRTLFSAPDPEWVAGDRFHVCAPQEAMDMPSIVQRVHAVLSR